MATITSHVLNAVNGTHAGGVRVDCRRIGDDGRAEPVFSVESGADGRITGAVDVDGADEGRVYELVFHTGEYFDREGLVEQARIMPEVVFRLRLPDPEARYHVPVIVSPHGYSVWWSS